jgi:hypothetical protein
MARRVLLHIGTPKTATTYLQDILFRNRDVLAKHGVHYPSEHYSDHFRAAINLTGREWGGVELEVVGEWDALAAKARSLDGTVIISSELLAEATPEQVRRAVDGFGDAEVHVVLTARDLGRQIPAEWQERIKYYNTETYAEFLSVITSGKGRSADLFWGVQHLPNILERWTTAIPAERVHLVTLPPPKAPRDVVLDRLVEAFGLEDIPLALDSYRTNTGLGANEAALLRLVNEHLPTSRWRDVLREVVASGQLAERTARTGSAPATLPPDLHPWVSELAADWIKRLDDAGYDVVGDLADLEPVLPTVFVDPDQPDEHEMLGAAVESIIALVVDIWDRIEYKYELLGELERTRAERDHFRDLPLRRRAAEKVVHRLDGSPAGRRALAVYRRARGRSSREA